MASTVPVKSRSPLHNFSSLSRPKRNSRHPRNCSSTTTTAVTSSYSHHQSSPFHEDLSHQQSLPSLRPGDDLVTGSLSLPSPVLQSSIPRGCSERSPSPPPSPQLLLGPIDDNELAKPECLSPTRGCADSYLLSKKKPIECGRNLGISVLKIEKKSVPEPNLILIPPKEPVSCNQEGKKKTTPSRILIRLPWKGKKECGKIAQEDGKRIDDLSEEKSMPRTWNLRPRNTEAVIDYDGKEFKKYASSLKDKGVLSTQVNHAATLESEKGKKRGLQISLTREDIEADFISITGSKPRRSPKKRSKIVQQQMDNLFPGSSLHSITADLYEVHHRTWKLR